MWNRGERQAVQQMGEEAFIKKYIHKQLDTLAYATKDTYPRITSDYAAHLRAMRLSQIALSENLITEFNKFKRATRSLLDWKKLTSFTEHSVVTLDIPTAKVTIYTNLKLNIVSSPHRIRREISDKYQYGVVKGHAARQNVLIATEFKDEKMAKFKWGKNIKSTLKKTKTVSLAGLIEKSQGCKSSEARDIAATIIRELQPPVVVVSKDIDAFVKMYETGPSSCMKPSSKYAEKWRHLYAENKLKTNKLPATWYHYVPGVYAAYMENSKGEVCARAIVFKLETGHWRYGTIYDDGTMYAETKFVEGIANKLKEEYDYPGPLRAMEEDSYEIPEAFDIPGELVQLDYKHKDYLCPIPYTDNIYGCNIYVKFDIPTKTFKFWPSQQTYPGNLEGDGYINQETETQQGYLFAKDVVVKKKCVNCGRRLEGIFTTTRDGVSFCHSDCAWDQGYRPAVNSNTNVILIPQGETVSELASTVFYTNIEAAYRNGAVPAPIITPNNPPVISRERFLTDGSGAGCYRLVYEGTDIGVSSGVYARLREGSIPGYKLLGDSILIFDPSINTEQVIDW